MTDGSMVGTVVRLVISLLVVLALLVLAARFLQKRQLGTGGRPRRQATGVRFEVVARHGLTRGASVAVVRVCDQLLLLGVTESSVQVLRELDEGSAEPATELGPATELEPVELEPVERPVPLPVFPQVRGASFAEVLRAWTVRRG